MRAFFVVFLTLLTPLIQGKDILEIHPGLEKFSAADYLYFYTDPEGKTSIKDILKPEFQEKFKKSKKRNNDQGITKDTIWIRLSFEMKEPGKWFILFEDNQDLLEGYMPQKDGSYEGYLNGTDIPYEKRNIKFNQQVFENPDGVFKGDIYFRIKSRHDKIILNPVILSPLGLVKYSNNDKTIQSIYLGIIISMIFYNLFIFLTIKDKSYFYYIIYLFFTGFGFLLGFNFLNSVFLPQIGGLYFPLSYLAIISGLGFGVQFTRSFLYLSSNFPLMDRILKISLYILPVVGVVYFIEIRLFIYLFYLLVTSIPFLMIFTGIKLYRKYLYAKIFTNAWGLYIATIVLYCLQFFDWVPFISIYLLETGQMVEAMLLSIALSYKIKELHFRANRDFLTGIYNRSSFQDFLSTQIVHKNKNKKVRDLSLILIDIDNFKQINDIFGHGVGDRVLQAFARLIPENIRIQDYFCRWGGEEFVIIAPETSLKQAQGLAEKLRKVIESFEFPVVGNITASFGVAGHENGESVRSFFHRADKAVYVAKENGRNKVEQAKEVKRS